MSKTNWGIERAASYIMKAMDVFKKINDRYSHQTGDKVLKKAAELLRENVRDADAVVRYGGGELLIMLLKPTGRLSPL